MQCTIGQLFQTRISPPTYSFRVTCPDMTAPQFAFLNRMLDDAANDTYPDFDNRTTTVVFENADPNGFRDTLEEQVIDKFIRRCCDPRSPSFISEEEYDLIDADNAIPV